MLKEQLKQQIATDTETNTRDFKDTNDYDTGVIQGYKEGYEIAGEHYAEKWQEAEERAERAEKALNLIAQFSDPGDHWIAICKMKSIAVDALTPKTGSDE